MMKKAIAIAGVCLFSLMLSAQTAPQSSVRCQAKIRQGFGSLVKSIDDFRGAKAIAALPAAERLQIVHALLTDVSRFYKMVGGDPRNLQPDRLQQRLQFKVLPGGRAGEQLMIVRLIDSSCGANDNCVAYVISLTPLGARSVLVGRDPSFGQSAGGASELGILQQPESSYPELLFLSHVSGFETAITCFTWDGGSRYVHVRCTPECAHFLDRPRPSDSPRDAAGPR